MKSSSSPVSSGLAWVQPQSASLPFSCSLAFLRSLLRGLLRRLLRGLLGSPLRSLLRSFPCSRSLGCLLHCAPCFSSGFSLRFRKFLLRRLLLVLRHRISPLSSIGCLTRPPSSMNLWGLATHPSTLSNRTLKKSLFTAAQPLRLPHRPSLDPPRPPLRPWTSLFHRRGVLAPFDPVTRRILRQDAQNGHPARPQRVKGEEVQTALRVVRSSLQ